MQIKIIILLSTGKFTNKYELCLNNNLNFTSRPKLSTRVGQYGQALEIAKLFKNKKNGFFIEAGAYDGEVYSNTLKFEMSLNWTGLLVEPNPDAFEELLTKNRKSYAIKTCLSTEPEVTEVSFDMAGKLNNITLY